MDSLSPVAPARVRCLVLPYGRIVRSRFQDFVARLRLEATVRLGNVSPNGGPDRNMFSPLAFPTGSVLFDITTSATTPTQRSLIPFELYRETLVVIGAADGQEYLKKTTANAVIKDGETPEGIEELSEGIAFLKESHPTAFVHQIFVFDCNLSGSDVPTDAKAIPPKDKLKSTTMKAVMCDLTSLLLAEMTTFARSVQALPNLEIPKPSRSSAASSDLPSRSKSSGKNGSRPESQHSNTPQSRTLSPAGDIDKHAHRASLPAHISSSNSAQSLQGDGRLATTAEAPRSPPLTFDEMDDLAERPAATSSAGNDVRSKKDRVSVTGFGSGSLGERARSQAQSRIGVVIGSMYLISGRWPDAVNALTESAVAAKANSDYAWHAKALDYLLVCVLMYAWAGLDFDIPQICYPFGEKSITAANKSARQTGTGTVSDASSANRLTAVQNLCNLLPDLTNNILHLYSRAAQFSSSPVPQVVFSETTIRLAKLLTLVQASFGSLNDEDLHSLVFKFSTGRDDSLMPEKAIPFLTKSEIASTLFRAFPCAGGEENIEVMDHLTILAGIASVLSTLGYHRKKAFVLRELMSLLLPALVQSRKNSAAELGVHPAASLSTFDLATSEVGVTGVLGWHDGMDHGIQSFLILICEVYGVIFASSGSRSQVRHLGTTNDYEDTSVIAGRALEHSMKRAFGNPVLKMDVLRSCINVCEALPDLRGVLGFSCDFLNTAGSGIAPSQGTTDSAPSIVYDDQARLVSNITRTISAAKQLGFDSLEAEYWDEFLVRDIEILTNSSSNPPLSRQKAELDLAAVNAEKKDGPFIYNPFAKPGKESRETILIAHEETVFVLRLQNLYDFELEIEWIKFDVADTLVEAQARGIVIGAYRTQQVNITATPRATGNLKIEACIAKIRGCRARRYPLFKKPWRMRQEIKMKRHGLAAASIPKERPLSITSDPARSLKSMSPDLPVSSAFDANVITTQPTVVLKSTSLPQSAIMILEGESRRFSITLHNASKVAVDLLLFSFTDSTSDALQANLENKELAPAELYEAEVGACQNPALRILPHAQGEELTIEPGADLTVEVKMFGKLGLTHGSMQIEYGYLGVPRSEVEDRFFTRQLAIPFSVTVSSSVDLMDDNILPFTSDFAWSNQQRSGKSRASPAQQSIANVSSPEQRFQALLSRLGLGSQGDDHCLVVLDFLNSWPNPISLSLQVRSRLPSISTVDDSWKRAYTVHELLQPGHKSRVLVLLPRLSLQNPHAPVPSLNPKNKRQFVLSATKVSPDLERLTREIFWYREEALKYIRASWSEPRSSRSGYVDLRRLTVTPRMLDALKLEEVDFELSLSPCASPTDTSATGDQQHSNFIRRVSRSHFSVPASCFLTLNVTLTSRLLHPIYPLLRLQPALRGQPYNIALDLSKKLAFNGVLQRPLPMLQPGEVRQAKLGVVFLAAGEYEVGACVEEVRVWRNKEKEEPKTKGRRRAMTGELGAEALVRTERRTWFAREACLVDVRAAEDI